MVIRGYVVRMAVVGLSLLAGLAIVPPTWAQPVTNQVIDRVSVKPQGTCFLVTVRFNLPMQYLSHFPLESGDELRIRLNPVINGTGNQESINTRESSRPRTVDGLPLESVTYEGETPEPYLSVQFTHPVSYTVSQGKDFRSILILLRPLASDPEQSCHPLDTPSD